MENTRLENHSFQQECKKANNTGLGIKRKKKGRKKGIWEYQIFGIVLRNTRWENISDGWRESRASSFFFRFSPRNYVTGRVMTSHTDVRRHTRFNHFCMTDRVCQEWRHVEATVKRLRKKIFSSGTFSKDKASWGAYTTKTWRQNSLSYLQMELRKDFQIGILYWMLEYVRGVCCIVGKFSGFGILGHLVRQKRSIVWAIKWGWRRTIFDINIYFRRYERVYLSPQMTDLL